MTQQRGDHVESMAATAHGRGEVVAQREQGEGIPRMFEEMALSLLPLPEIDVVAGRFRVILRGEPIFSAGVDHEWARTVRAMPLAVTQKRALVGFQDRDFALNGVDRDTAYEELRQLVDAGLLDATGTDPGTRYRVHPRVRPPRGPRSSA